MTGPLEITGRSIIAGADSAFEGRIFHAVEPATGVELPEAFHEANESDVHAALSAARDAWGVMRRLDPHAISAFLESAAAELDTHAEQILARATLESGLPLQRMTGELARTTGQLRMFAHLVAEGSWVEAVIDRGDTHRSPAPKPDLRRMRVSIGPVVVFGASNFPLAFSVAGGDTASAFAGGNPVVVKAHPSHPGTCELVARCIVGAAKRSAMPPGVFSLLHGAGTGVGEQLVLHGETAAVGFTGSAAGGLALQRAAQSRPRPIPVFAEMGSVNPVVVLPAIQRERSEWIGTRVADSASLGAGQFCTKPGLLFCLDGPGYGELKRAIESRIEASLPQVMLNAGIADRFARRRENVVAAPGVAALGGAIDTPRGNGRELQSGARKAGAAGASGYVATLSAAEVDARTFATNRTLHEEVFGPFLLLVRARTTGDLLDALEAMDGQLTATIYGTVEECADHRDLVEAASARVGRLIFNGVPTGVDVVPAMHHGGPYPSTTDSRATSVGTAAIERFTRPLAYQDWPDELLPPELKDANPRGLLRLVDNAWTREPVSSR